MTKASFLGAVMCLKNRINFFFESFTFKTKLGDEKCLTHKNTDKIFGDFFVGFKFIVYLCAIKI